MAATFEQITSFVGLAPAVGTYGIAANTLCLKGTIACVDSDGNTTPGALNAGLAACGIYQATFDNRATAFTGGVAGNEQLPAEVQFGVHELAYTGTAPTPGQVVWVYDNNTVTTDSNSNTRGICGYCVTVDQVTTGKCTVLMGPHIVAQIVIAAAVAGRVTQSEADIDALQADALSANAVIRVPLTSFTAADATPLAKFADGSSATFGLNWADSKALALRWNNHATPGTVACQVGLPPDLDDTAAIEVEFLASKTGATAGDATTITVAAYITAAGSLHDAATDVGGVTNALVGNATAKTTAVLTRTITGANVPADARSMTLTATPTAGTLGTDDLLIHDVLVRYTRKLRTA